MMWLRGLKEAEAEVPAAMMAEEELDRWNCWNDELKPREGPEEHAGVALRHLQTRQCKTHDPARLLRS